MLENFPIGGKKAGSVFFPTIETEMPVLAFPASLSARTWAEPGLGVGAARGDLVMPVAPVASVSCEDYTRYN